MNYQTSVILLNKWELVTIMPAILNYHKNNHNNSFKYRTCNWTARFAIIDFASI